MINFDNVTEEIIKFRNLSSPQIPDHPYRILLLEVQDLEKQIYYLIYLPSDHNRFTEQAKCIYSLLKKA